MKVSLLGRLVAIALVVSSCAGAAPAGASAAPAGTGAAPAGTGAAPAGATATGATPAARTKLVVGYASLSATQLPAWVAKERGFFEQNGLDVELLSIANGQLGTAALLSGDVQVIQIATEPIQVGLTGQADLVYIAAPQTVLFFRLYAVPSVSDAAQLKGKTVGITAIGSVTNTAAKMALRSLKLDPEKDVQLVVLNSIPDVLAGLQSGAIAAGILSSPTTIRAREAGMHELVDVARLGNYLTAWQATSRKYIDANPDVIRRYTKAIVQAIAFEIRQPAETQQILGKYLKISNAAILKESYDELVPHLRRIPTPDLPTVRNVLDELASTVPAAKTADPARFVDDRFVKELEASGFIAGLYK